MISRWTINKHAVFEVHLNFICVLFNLVLFLCTLHKVSVNGPFKLHFMIGKLLGMRHKKHRRVSYTLTFMSLHYDAQTTNPF